MESAVHEVGEFGKYQLLHVLLLAVPCIAIAQQKLAWVFLGAQVNHRCLLDGETLNATFKLDSQEQLDLIPWNDNSHSFSQCKMIVENNTEVDCDRGFVYDREEYETSAVIDYDLVCERRWLHATAQSCFMLGMTAGAFLFGALSDSIGRKQVLVFGGILILVLGAICASLSSFIFFLAARVLLGIAIQGTAVVSYTILMETSGRRRRPLAGSIMQFMATIGFFSTAMQALLIKSWRNLQIALALPASLCLLYCWFLPESFRWLESKGRHEETMELLLKAAKMNGKTVTREQLEVILKGHDDVEASYKVASYSMEEQITKSTDPKNHQKESHIEESLKQPTEVFQQSGSHKIEISNKGNANDTTLEQRNECNNLNNNNPEVKEKTVNFLDLMIHPKLRTISMKIYAIWFVSTAVYYGLSLGTSELGGNHFLNFAISGAVEIPAHLVVTFSLNRFGRRQPLALSLALSGGILLLILVTPKDMVWLIITLAMLGKMFITISYGSINVITTEVFPTVVRNVGLGSSSMVGRIGGAFAPYVNFLGNVWSPLPMLIFGVSALLSSSLALMLPETKDRPLPQHIEDA